MVIGRAIISDLAAGKAAARAFSLMMIVGGVAPVIAPLAGGFLVAPIGWRGALAVILALSTLMLLAVLSIVRETHTEQRRARTAIVTDGVGITAARSDAVAPTSATPRHSASPSRR